MLNIAHNSWLGWLLRLPLRLLPKRAVVPVLRGINRGFAWRVGASIHGCWLGHYEMDKQRRLSELVNPGMVAYDIGANAGFYSLAFSRMVGGQGSVHAFEPLAENAANILEHMRLNACANLSLYQVAVSDHDGFSAFQVAPSNAMGHLTDAGAYRVPTVRIDSLIEATDLPPPDIVKMDVEGAESRVLAGARKLLQMRKTIWLVALHGAEQRQRVGRILLEHDYRLFRLDGSEIAAAAIDTDEIYALPGQGGA